MLQEVTKRVASGRTLDSSEVEALVGELVSEAVVPEVKASFLMALAQRGETPEEITAFVRALRERSVQPPLSTALRDQGILDVVGTGGDRLNTFNISSASALVASAAGLCVAKHGNRAVTSKSGSADVLEALGIRIDLSPEEVGEWLARHRFAFLFAPNFHPAFRHIAPARKLCAAAGHRTLFNFLGPLLNPVRPTAQLMGVARPELGEPMARVLQSLGVRRAMVVCGSVPVQVGGPEPNGAWLDELSTLGASEVSEFYQERALSSSTLALEWFPVQAARLEDLRGGSREDNAVLVRRILSGEEQGPTREAVLLNAGAAIFVGGGATSIGEGWKRAEDVINSGAAGDHLQRLIQASR